ncbi:ABC transporter permease [Mesorhizobium sp. CA8]|uniref:ABC transporter permease n=1 Tax=unclassified Mesorhizobium TaxID=325217 RepID=UPI001CC99D48|nr:MULTISPECIES: ABC transporter permease [unclassified Mesorhizobium]MBZ9761684.1 ABC transporter permease [Mesorhizobium sp. CA8]MBZ9820562.1 ABC transporter permease [Mesorhizobium sp. CA4]
MAVGTAMVALVIGVAVLGPMLAPHTPTQFVQRPYALPSAKALLGTDGLGRDVLSRVLNGGFSVLWMSLAATAIGAALGTTIGLVAGYSRSIIDDVLMWLTDVVLAFPQVVLVLLFVSMLGPQLWLIVLVVSISHAPRVARMVRGVTIEIVNQPFIEAAETIGVPTRDILLRELLPNLVTPLMVEIGLRMTWSIGIVAGISFLGFGIQPPASDWGLMISENRDGLILQPFGVLAPLAMIAVFTIGTNLLAEAISRSASNIGDVSPNT